MRDDSPIVLTWEEWQRSRAAKRAVLKAAGLDAPSRRRRGWGSSERRLQKAFGPARAPTVALSAVRQTLEHSQALSDRTKRLAEPMSSKKGLSVRSLDYDAETRSGIIRVSFPEGSFNEARTYARQSIEKMVNDKNVVLVSGEKTTAGLFRIGDERVLNGNLLEMEFSVE